MNTFMCHTCVMSFVTNVWEQGWHSGEGTHLPPVWPATQVMWVEFVVGSHPCPQRFFSGYSGRAISILNGYAVNKPLLLLLLLLLLFTALLCHIDSSCYTAHSTAHRHYTK